MNRRDAVLALLALGAAPHNAGAQQPAKIARVGYLSSGSASGTVSWVEGFRVGLRELGYVEGKTIVIEWRFAEGTYERLPALVAELVRLKIDVLVAPGSPAIRAARQATGTIPIVMAPSEDPVGAGFIKRLARPGGNIKGITNISSDLAHKQIDLLREVVPKLSRVGFLVNPENPLHVVFLKSSHAASQRGGVQAMPVIARALDEIERAFLTMREERVGAVVVEPDPFFIGQAQRVAELAAVNQLPSAMSYGRYAEAGGFVGYGPDYADINRRAATYVDKILKGAKPGDLPIEQPTKFELVINLKTAKALGLTIPRSILLRADRVIE